MLVPILCDIPRHCPSIMLLFVFEGLFLSVHPTLSYESKSSHSEMSGVCPVTYLMPVRPVLPQEILLKIPVCWTRPEPQIRFGTFLDTISRRKGFFRCTIPHFTLWSWLDHYTSECVRSMHKLFTSAWIFVCFPVISGAISDLNWYNIPKFLKNRRSISPTSKHFVYG